MLNARSWQAGALGVFLALVGTSTVGAQPVGDPGDIGSELWAWGWAGYKGQNLVLGQSKYGPVVTQMNDLSGRGNHFFANSQYQPAYATSLELPSSTKGGAYQTSLPVVGLDSYADGSNVYGNVMYQNRTLNAAGGFYLAAVCMNTRNGGTRQLFGSTNGDVVHLDQGLDAVFMTVGGQWRRLCPDGDLPKGIMVLEIWRDSKGVMTCFANGNKVTQGTVKTTKTSQISGFGFDGSGSSQWDDYSMEFVMCDALPPKSERDMIREYLRAKWNVWGAPSPPKAVITPASAIASTTVT